MPMQHAAVGGSAISRILRCPGSVRLAANLPRTSTPAADRGTMLHKMMERVLVRGHEPAALVGQSHAGVRLEPGDAKAMLVPARAMTYRFIGDAPLLVEQKVRFEKHVWGTADLLAHRARIGYLADYKFGETPVNSDSEQLKFYAAAAWEQKRFGAQPLAVKAAVIQPAVSTKVEPVTYEPKQLTDFAKQVRAIAKVALSDNAPVIPGEVQCQWCPVKQAGVCPALKAIRSAAPTDLTSALLNLSSQI